jgi:exopolysaccharide biosynthesis polyprenyl glycosylphosphotransferase
VSLPEVAQGRKQPAEALSFAAPYRRSLDLSERRVLLVVMDVLLLLLVGYGISWDTRGPGNFPGLALLFAIPWLFLTQITGLYDLSTASRPKATLTALATTTALFDLVLLVTWFVVGTSTVHFHLVHGHWVTVQHYVPAHGGDARAFKTELYYFISRPKLFIFMLAGPAVIGLWRLIYIHFFGAAHFQRKVLIVGAGTAAATLLHAIRANEGHGIAVMGLIDDDPAKQHAAVDGFRVLGDSARMWPLVSDMSVEEVVLAINQPSSPSLYQGLGTCYEHSIAVSLMPQMYEEVTGQVPVEHMGPHWFGSVQLGRSGGSIAFAFKRIVDIALGLIAVIVTLPVALVLAVIIKLTSKGSIFHRQERVGLHGKPFNIVKFRTMREDAEKPGEAVWAELDDPRATAVGRWLRRTHLDELPQFYLVVKGDMSLVGPRPERPEFVRELESTLPLYRARYSMRPGIAGWAQIHYPYGASVDDALAKLRYDLYYVKNWTPLLDTSIMVRTITRVIGLRGR